MDKLVHFIVVLARIFQPNQRLMRLAWLLRKQGGRRLYPCAGIQAAAPRLGHARTFHCTLSGSRHYLRLQVWRAFFDQGIQGSMTIPMQIEIVGFAEIRNGK